MHQREAEIDSRIGRRLDLREDMFAIQRHDRPARAGFHVTANRFAQPQQFVKNRPPAFLSDLRTAPRRTERRPSGTPPACPPSPFLPRVPQSTMPYWCLSCAWSSAIRAGISRLSALPSSPGRAILPWNAPFLPSAPPATSAPSPRLGALHTTMRFSQGLLLAFFHLTINSCDSAPHSTS